MRKSVFFGTLSLALCLTGSVGYLAAETREETAASYLDLGDKFAHHGDFNRAIGAYNIALQFVPDFAPAYFNRGLAYEARGEFSKAIADYTRTLDIVPGLTTAFYNRGNLRFREGDMDGAWPTSIRRSKATRVMSWLTTTAELLRRR